MSLPGCFGPWISTGIIMNFRLLTITFVPCHQLSIFFISEKTLPTWYYRKVLHHFLKWWSHY
jgi:hypothetical protein